MYEHRFHVVYIFIFTKTRWRISREEHYERIMEMRSRLGWKIYSTKRLLLASTCVLYRRRRIRDSMHYVDPYRESIATQSIATVSQAAHLKLREFNGLSLDRVRPCRIECEILAR